MPRIHLPILCALLVLNAARTATAALIIVGDQPGTFVDIDPANGGGGTALHLNSSNPFAIVQVNTISNSVFNINPGDNITIHNNGGIAWGPPPSNNLSNLNQHIPSIEAFGGGKCFLPFWDDIDTVGDVFVREDADQRLIVEWKQKGFENSPPTETTTFEVQIFDSGAFRGHFPIAQYLYADVEGARAGHGDSATIGFQNDGGAFNDFEWSFNTPSVSNGTVLSVIIPEPATLALLVVGALMAFRRR